MTQLFDTAGYDTETSSDITGDTASATGRHLRSVGTDTTSGGRINWRLDDQTIEVGRRGIAKAREALRQSRAATPATERRAA